MPSESRTDEFASATTSSNCDHNKSIENINMMHDGAGSRKDARKVKLGLN